MPGEDQDAINLIATVKFDDMSHATEAFKAIENVLFQIPLKPTRSLGMERNDVRVGSELDEK